MIELLVVCSVIALLAALVLPALSNVGTKARASKCLNNLKQLGTGVNIYLSDMNERLPYAALRTAPSGDAASQVWSWDDLLHPYIGGRLDVNQLGQDAVREADSGIEVLICPSDHLKPENWTNRPAKRSYSMARHQMTTNPEWSFVSSVQAWPPNSASRSGAGLNWDLSQHVNARTLGWNTGELASSKGAGSHQIEQASIQMPFVMDAANTILLTERICPENVQGNDREATIINAASHVDAPGLRRSTFHDGCFNYLMIDGHVEHLQPRQTLGNANTDLHKQSGMWTIAADD